MFTPTRAIAGLPPGLARAALALLLALHHLRVTGSMKDMAIATASGQLSDGTLRKSSDAAALFAAPARFAVRRRVGVNNSHHWRPPGPPALTPVSSLSCPGRQIRSGSLNVTIS